MNRQAFFTAHAQSPRKQRQALEVTAYFAHRTPYHHNQLKNYSLRRTLKLAKQLGWDASVSFRSQPWRNGKEKRRFGTNHK
jgi:hypothetical protein